MMGKFILLTFFLTQVLFPVFSQTDDATDMLQVPLFLTENNPESPAGIFSLEFPFYFGTGLSSGHHLSFGYSMGNVWNPQAWFYYPVNLTARQADQVDNLFMTLRPEYFKEHHIKTNVKSYQADGVLQHFRFSWLNKWKDRNSLIVNINLHHLTSGKAPWNFPVSDRFIEEWHSSVAVEDNFGRRLYPFNRAAIEFKDEKGSVFRKDKGDVFLGVMDLHYYRQLAEVDRPDWHFSTQAAFHLSVPLNNFHSYLIPGVNVGFRSDFLLGQRTSLTLAYDFGLSWQNSIKTGSSLHVIDNNSRVQSSFYAGLNMKTKKRIFVFGILNQYQGPLTKGGEMDWDQTDYDQIGIQFLEEGDTWEGEPITQQFWLAKLTPAALYNFSVRTYFILGFHKKQRAFHIYVMEDMITINNAPDFQVGFQYSFRLPWKRD